MGGPNWYPLVVSGGNPICSFRQFLAKTYRFARIQNVTDDRQTDRQTTCCSKGATDSMVGQKPIDIQPHIYYSAEGKRLCFYVRLFVRLSVCPLDFLKIIPTYFAEAFWRGLHGPRTNHDLDLGFLNQDHYLIQEFIKGFFRKFLERWARPREQSIRF